MKKYYKEALFFIPGFLIGLVMLIFPTLVIDLFDTAISLIFIFVGLKYLIDEYYLKSSTTRLNPLLLGVLNIALGLVILFGDGSILDILPALVAIGCMIYSVSILIKALNTRVLASTSTVFMIIMSVLVFVLGIILFSNLGEVSELFVRIIGLLIILSLFNVNVHLLKPARIKTVKRLKKK